MAITDLETATTAIEVDLGDQDTEDLSDLIPIFWNARSDKVSVICGLQFQYTFRDCADVVIGQLWKLVDKAEGDQKETLSQKLKGVQLIRSNCQEEIVVLEKRARSNRPPVVAQITATAPVAPWIPPLIRPDIWRPSPNDPAYSGSPIRNKGVPGNEDF